jgi:crotonobetainyl-CoA:carnitine CoA-transferase CaiB-like acyl-CoA transferase
VKPLQGIKVIDLTVYAFCPAASGILASWGADVIHIENPSAPDPMRFQFGGTPTPGGSSWMFKHYNRGKRSISLDIASDGGREILYRLVRNADVFLTNMLPASRRKLRVDVDDLRAQNPRLVFAKGSGAGPLGPESDRRGYDILSWWSRGSLASTTMAVTATESPPGMIGHGDGMSGLVFAGGICAGLLQRELTGVAPVVDSSLMGTAMWLNAPAIITSAFAPERRVFNSASIRHDIWLSNNYRTKDGRYLVLCYLGDSQRDWEGLCQAVGRPELAMDPRFASSEDRTRNSKEIIKILDGIFDQEPLHYWTKALSDSPGAWAAIQAPNEVYEDPQAVANGFIKKVVDASGELSLVMPPIMFDEDTGELDRAPDIGEHTAEVLSELGLDAAQIERLRQERVAI